jgi:hypothetical protein
MVVSESEYASETERVAGFLRSDGESLVESIRTMRDRLSESLDFEEAARMHKRLEKAQAAVALRGELATDIHKLCGIVVVPSVELNSVLLWVFADGAWRGCSELSLAIVEGRPGPMDRRLREAVGSIPLSNRVPLKDRQDHLSLLTAWFFSSWREGEWVGFENVETLPYRKLVNAVHRVAKQTCAELQ